MKKRDLSDLAQKTNVSKATISRALNHCPGVDHETRRRVLEAAGPLSPSSSEDDMVMILPDTPRYFWNPAFIELQAATAGLRRRFHLYSRLYDTDEVALYLDQAARHGARLMLLSAADTPETVSLLREYAGRIPLFLLSEYLDITGTFYIGSHAYDDGRRLGEAYLTHFCRYPRVVCISSDANVNGRKRLEGFVEALAAKGEPPPRRMTLPLPGKSQSAQLARQLHEIGPDGFDCIVCADGFLPQVCLAVQKLGLHKKVICMGFENPPGNRPYLESGLIAAYVAQDIVAQCRTAADLAKAFLDTGTYPPSKFTYCPSTLVVNPKAIP